MYQQHHTAEELAEMLRDAQNPATPPERLRSIVQSKAGDAKNYPLREAVAANPNAPADLLINLAAYHPAAFCRNPAASLYLLERPDFLRRMPQKRGLLRCADPPALFLEALSRHGDRKLREEVGMHVAVAGEVPDAEWRRALTAFWRAEVARAPKADRVAYAELAALGLAPDWAAADPAAVEDLRSLLLRASDPDTPAVELDRIWTASGARPETVRLWNGTGFEDRVAWRVVGSTWSLPHLAVSLNPSLPPRIVNGRPFCAYHETRYAVEVVPGGQRVLSAREFIARHLPHYPLAHDAPTPPAGPDTQQHILAAVRDAASVVGRSARLPFSAVCARLRPDHPPPPAAQAQRAARSNHWHERLSAVFDLQPRHRKSAEALETLAGDGNRLVRAAAQARLRGEAFSWED